MANTQGNQGGTGRGSQRERGGTRDGNQGKNQGGERGGRDGNRNGSERGFAAMDAERQREIASMGGRAAHQQGTAHEFDSEEAREAGRRGGEAVSQNREHMAEIGALGGRASRSGNGSRSGTASRTSNTDQQDAPHGTSAGDGGGLAPRPQDEDSGRQGSSSRH